MSTIPPGMWTDPSDFSEEFRTRQEEDLAQERAHEHGRDCGHEAVEHGDHVDYIDGEHRHWWNRGRWEKHEPEEL
jgi:zinc transport system permease protein